MEKYIHGAGPQDDKPEVCSNVRTADDEVGRSAVEELRREGLDTESRSIDADDECEEAKTLS